MLPELDRLGRPPRLLGLFAHPDDEIFCGGGLFAECSDRGSLVRIVSFTRGEAGQIRDAKVAARATLGSVRVNELRSAAAELGVVDVSVHSRGDGTLSRQSMDELVALALEEIADHRPDVIIAFGPDGAYGHPDHIRMSEVATEAGTRAGISVYHAVFPRRSQRLTDLLVDWLTRDTDWFRGSPGFAHALMLLAEGSSMLGLASDHLQVRFSPPGAFVVEQGERSHELFLILAGEVDILLESDDGTTKVVDSAGPGTFFGERGLANSAPRAAHVVATSALTCLVLSPSRPSMAAGRGSTSGVASLDPEQEAPVALADHVLDVTVHAHRKMQALVQHRSQYALTADMLPASIVTALLGTEYFNRAPRYERVNR